MNAVNCVKSIFGSNYDFLLVTLVGGNRELNRKG